MSNNVDKYKNPGKEYNRTLEGRYRYVIKWFEIVSELGKDDYIDDDDMEYILKDAMVGGVYFSKAAMEMVMHNPTLIHPIRVRPLINKIAKEGRFLILDENDFLHCEGLEIDDFFKQSNSNYFHSRLRFEHVIPYKFYIDELYRLFKDNAFDLDMFRICMKSINICIVLDTENSRLDKMYKSDMPQGWQWGDEPFARYKEADIKIWSGGNR